jgi:hypothetical protein
MPPPSCTFFPCIFFVFVFLFFYFYFLLFTPVGASQAQISHFTSQSQMLQNYSTSSFPNYSMNNNKLKNWKLLFSILYTNHLDPMVVVPLVGENKIGIALRSFSDLVPVGGFNRY